MSHGSPDRCDWWLVEDGHDYFFHRSGVQSDFDRLIGGEKVNFEEASPKGPRAKDVRVA